MPPKLNHRKILIVDDEKLIRWSLNERLRREGYEVEEATDGASALRLIGQDSYDLLLLDFRLPDTDGLQVLKRVKERNPQQVVILMTAYSSVENAVEAMRLGAYDYINKPFNMDELVLDVEKALETVSLRSEVSRLQERDRATLGLSNIVGSSEVTNEIRRMVKRIAESGATTILISGESGTGKGLIATAIHYESQNADRPFMNITCTALPETLLESELFGHERGAFTDAHSQKKGLLELAHTGTAFLDEVGDMPLNLQAKLLRFLEEKKLRRVGGTRDINVDVRIVAATNRDLKVAVQKGAFRPDLFYRLNVIPLKIPPLRERREDIPDLVQHFVGIYNAEFKKSIKGFDAAALDLLCTYAWPGNIRELKNAIERAILLTDSDVLDSEDLPYEIRERGTTAAVAEPRNPFQLPREGINIDDLERTLLQQALQVSSGNKTKAGRMLGLNRDQVRYWMKKYRLAGNDEAEGE
ncbi:MAG: sigma-54 dependent transcriptional regulator [Planctomycetota bacterium]